MCAALTKAETEGDADYFYTLGNTGQIGELEHYVDLDFTRSEPYFQSAFLGASAAGDIQTANWLIRRVPQLIKVAASTEWAHTAFFEAAEHERIAFMQWMTHNKIVDRQTVTTGQHMWHMTTLWSCLRVGRGRIFIDWNDLDPIVMKTFFYLVESLASAGGLASVLAFIPLDQISKVIESYTLHSKYKLCVDEIHRLCAIYQDLSTDTEETQDILAAVHREYPPDRPFVQEITIHSLRNAEHFRNLTFEFIRELQGHSFSTLF